MCDILVYHLNILLAVTFLFFSTLLPASAMKVKLIWNKNGEHDLAGYKVYCDTDANIAQNFGIKIFTYMPYDLNDPHKTVSTKKCPFWIDLPIHAFYALEIDPNKPTCELNLKTPDNLQIYYFVVSAYDMQGLESSPSNVVDTAVVDTAVVKTAEFFYNSMNDDGGAKDPGKKEPGVCGCGVPDKDADSDGILDCKDGCPNDPDKIASGICGCGASDRDSDGDGIADCLDNCPNDPGKTETGVCGCGVPDKGPESCGFYDTDKMSVFEAGIQGITAVAYDETRDFLWVGTDEGELFAFNLQVQEWEEKYTKSDGLNGDPIISISIYD